MTDKQCPTLNPRRPLEPDAPSGYLESDKDFALNNLAFFLWCAEHADEIVQLRGEVATPEERQAAIDTYGSDDVRIDDTASVSRSTAGYWVQAWVWVPNDDIG